MKALEAHELIAEAYAADPEAVAAWLPPDSEPQHPEGVDPTVALLTAVVVLSGMLADAETLDDLKAGSEHFATLLSAEIVSAEDWNKQTLQTIDELLAWGDAVTAQERN